MTAKVCLCLPDAHTPENVCMAAIEAIRTGFTKYTDAAGTKAGYGCNDF